MIGISSQLLNMTDLLSSVNNERYFPLILMESRLCEILFLLKASLKCLFVLFHVHDLLPVPCRSPSQANSAGILVHVLNCEY